MKIEYELSLDDGTVLEATAGKEPLEVEVGGGQIMARLDRALLDMKVGEEREIIIPPTEAFGELNPDLVLEIPMDSFPDGMLLKPGFVFEITLPSGEKVPASVIEISDEMVTVDLNHPLAGRILLATIKVVAIVQ